MQIKQNETPVHYEKKSDEVKPDYTPQRTYEPQSTSREQTSDRRGFLKRTGTAVIVGLGGILFGKTAMAEDSGNDGIDDVIGDEDGLKKVTSGYDRRSENNYDGVSNCGPGDSRGGCYPERPCGPEIHCEPNCNPNNKCHPECGPHSENNSDFKKVTRNYDTIGKDNSGGVYNCKPGYCKPDLGDCTPFCEPPKPCSPNCTPPPEPCYPNCTP